MLLSQPDYGEQALEIVDMLVKSGEYSTVVVDSVAALTPKAELEGEMGKSHVGLHARMMSQGMRKVAASAKKGGTLLIFINQIRMKIGVMFGSPETTTGGQALKYYSSVRLDIRRIGGVKDGEDQIANRTRVKVRKNKCAPPFKEAEFNIEFGRGIDRETELIELGVSVDAIQKSGAWLSRNGERIGQGRAKAAALLKDLPDLAAEIENEIRQALKAKS
jgi:recombination protein RecA